MVFKSSWYRQRVTAIFTSIYLSPVKGLISFSQVIVVISSQINFGYLWFESKVSNAFDSLAVPNKILYLAFSNLYDNQPQPQNKSITFIAFVTYFDFVLILNHAALKHSPE